MFAGHGNFRTYDLADQANEVLQEILRAVLRVDLVSYFEQGTTLLAAKPPTTRPGFIGGHNAMKSSGGKIIVPSLGIAAHEAPWVLSILPCNNTAKDTKPLSMSG
jgi:hypothetical protein